MPTPSRERRSNVIPLRHAPKTNAHAPLGAFVGREAVLERLGALVDGGARIVTILGPPGMGKTRLAQRLLEIRGARYEDGGGAWFCDLSEVRDEGRLAHAVASLFPPSDVDVGDYVSSLGPTLLVLDNFEQLVGAAHVVNAWCRRAPELRIVVTSRERLGVEGEVVVELAPLACPDDDAVDAAVLECEAVRLLAARATAVGGGLGDDARAVAALVRRLDGIPLAIELAAARTRVLRPIELLARLDRRSDLLAGTPRGAGRRHATLSSAIDWSWNLLAPDEQRALAECSVFAGGFTVDAAEHVVSSPPQDSGAALRIAALRDKSLVRSAEGDGRLALFVSIREYAAGKLEAAGERAVRDLRWRHARYYAAAARASNESRMMQGAAPDAKLRVELKRERDNLLAALAFVQSEPLASAVDIGVLAELAIALTLLAAAPTDLCLGALGAALDLLDAIQDADPSLRMRILLSRHDLLNAAGRPDESKRDKEALLAIPGAPRGVRAYALAFLGIQQRYLAEYRDAWRSHEAAARELEGLDLPRMTAMNTACMGRLACDFGDAAAARELNERARRIALGIGDVWLQALPLANVAQLEQGLGDFARARALLEQALSLLREAGEPMYVAIYTAVMGDLCFEEGLVDDARRSYAFASEFLAGWTQHRHTAMLFASWAALEAMHGTRDDAEAHMSRAQKGTQRGGSAAVRLFLELTEGVLALRRATEGGDDAARERWNARARTLRAPGDADHEVCASSLDVRFALRMLERALDGGRPRGEGRGLVVGDGWFAIGKGRRVDLLRRGSLRRILAALAAEHARRPGGALDHDALLAAGWPGERPSATSASTRLRVAIATLRRLGLRDVLVTRDDGYLLDPHAAITVERDV